MSDALQIEALILSLQSSPRDPSLRLIASTMLEFGGLDLNDKSGLEATLGGLPLPIVWPPAVGDTIFYHRLGGVFVEAIVRASPEWLADGREVIRVAPFRLCYDPSMPPSLTATEYEESVDGFYEHGDWIVGSWGIPTSPIYSGPLTNGQLKVLESDYFEVGLLAD